MISLTQFRNHCLPLFKLMRDTGTELEVVYKGKVYEIAIRHTDKEPKLTRIKTKQPEDIKHVNVDNCPECGALMFNDICVNTRCLLAKGRPRMDMPTTTPQQTE